MQDLIQREITIRASKERVYDAIANPELVVKWFPETIDGSYKVGEQPVFGFGDHGKNQILIVAADPHEYFAYRWVPGANQFIGDVNTIASTLVEFRIEEKTDGTCLVKLSESGFKGLPAEQMEAAFNQNSGGWNFMLGRLTDFFENA